MLLNTFSFILSVCCCCCCCSIVSCLFLIFYLIVVGGRGSKGLTFAWPNIGSDRSPRRTRQQVSTHTLQLFVLISSLVLRWLNGVFSVRSFKQLIQDAKHIAWKLTQAYFLSKKFRWENFYWNCMFSCLNFICLLSEFHLFIMSFNYSFSCFNFVITFSEFYSSRGVD